MWPRLSRLCLLALTGLGGAAHAQMPVPRAEDVATIDAVMRTFYEVISGPAGQPRAWRRDSSLYIPEVRFVSMSEQNGRPVANLVDHAQYARQSDPMLLRGFFETEVHKVVRRFGNIAHVFSTYEFRTTANGPVLGRGVNSLQLYWDGARWWVTNVIWDGERANNPIPRELLP
jgi:hypothetical protein